MKKAKFDKIVYSLADFLASEGCILTLGITNRRDTWQAKNNHTFIIDEDHKSKVFAIFHRNENRKKDNFLCWMDDPDLLIKAKQFILMNLY